MLAHMRDGNDNTLTRQNETHFMKPLQNWNQYRRVNTGYIKAILKYDNC